MTRGEGYRLLPHTADMGIEAWATCREDLFTAAAQGLREMIFGKLKSAPTAERSVKITADEEGELLVAWLNEILYNFEVRGLVPAAFEISTIEKGMLQATILGEPYAPERHPVQREVKAVTYHQLTIEHRPEGWYAKLFVDL